MKFIGTPNQLVNMDIDSLTLKFDSEGVFDLDLFMDDLKTRVILPRVLNSKRFALKEEAMIEDVEIQEEVKEEAQKEVQVYKCKVEGCGEEFTNKGLFLAHCREHKKEEKESEV